MVSSRTAPRDWALYERVARSLAHSVGNTINVVFGRLSIVELDPGLRPESKHAIERARLRLRSLQHDLESALRWPPLERVPNDPLGVVIERLATELNVELHHAEVLERDPIAHQPGRELGLRCLENASRVLDPSATPEWHLGVRELHGEALLTLTVSLDASRAPAERKALLEPWFSEEARALDGAERHGRLLLAQALGLLEDANVTLDIESSSPALTSITLVWYRVHA
jgi:hypothetical protein